MPISYGRDIIAGTQSPYVPMIPNNPAFKVSIVAVDGKLEQKPNAKSDAKEQEAIQIGDMIQGEVVSMTRKKGDKVTGKVIAIDTDVNQNITLHIPCFPIDRNLLPESL